MVSQQSPKLLFQVQVLAPLQNKDIPFKGLSFKGLEKQGKSDKLIAVANKDQGSTAVVAAIIITLLLGVIGLLAYQNFQLRSLIKGNLQQKQAYQTESQETIITPTEEPLPTPTPESNISNIPAGWKVYKNETYGFQIAYPEGYKVLTDKNNLYGWPNAVALIYGGGQSYDLPIEVWNSTSAYLEKYQNEESLVVKKIGNKYITLVNTNKNPEVDKIIATFTLLEE